ncbi:MAG: YjbQ family protein [Spirochaetaceae bacterium]|nr:YjbQ family protein [Spirochaetaceae bacterium]RKX80776.1 MAG: YjbQ family protein [Spirochaetota bacterium]RKX95923.1 MAG: YjbQ family protein [Spirochaetota bacterium]
MTIPVSLSTASGSSMTDISSDVASAVSKSGIKEGICLVSSPHTTAGITINENADPDVKTDMMMEIDKLIPLSDGYLHMEGNSAAHIKATFTGLSVTLPVSEGQLVLGTWQGIYFCDYDGPRQRRVLVTIIG